MLPGRLRRWALLALTLLLFVALGAAVAARAAHWRRVGWAGLVFLFRPPAGEVAGMPLASGTVLRVAPGSPAAAAGILPGDLVLSVDGVALADAPGLAALAARRRWGDRVTYQLDTDVGRRRLTLPLVSPFAAPGRRLGALLALLLAAGCLAAGWWGVALPRPPPGAGVMYGLCCLGALSFTLPAVAGLDQQLARGLRPLGAVPAQLAPYALFGLVFVVLTNLLLHLALVFPCRRPLLRGRRWLLGWLHSLPLTPWLAAAAWFAGLVASRRQLVVLMVVLAAGLLAGLGLGLRAARREGWCEAFLRRPLACQAMALAVLLLSVPAARSADRLMALLASVGFLALVVFTLLQITLYSLWTCGALYRSYRAGGRRTRQRLRWPLVGALATLWAMLWVAGVYFAAWQLAPAAVLARPWMLEMVSLTVQAVNLLLPLTLACGLVGWRLPLADRLLRPSLLWGALGSGALALHLVAAPLLAAVLPAPLAAALAVALALVGAILARPRLAAWADRRGGDPGGAEASSGRD